MKNRKKIIITLLLVLLLLLVAIFFVFKYGNLSNNIGGQKAIKELNSLQKEKSTYIVFVGASGEIINNNIIVNKLQDNYKDLKIVKFDYSQQNLSSLKSILDANNLTDVIKKQNYMLVFKNGSFVGAYFNVDNYDNVLNYLYSKEIIKKPIITEMTTFDQFTSDINSKYLLILVSEDDHVKMINKYIDRFSSLVKYNIVNIKGIEGSKIYKYVLDKYKITPIIPQAIYFKDSKVVKSYVLHDYEDTYLEIKEELEKK